MGVLKTYFARGCVYVLHYGTNNGVHALQGLEKLSQERWFIKTLQKFKIVV